MVICRHQEFAEWMKKPFKSITGSQGGEMPAALVACISGNIVSLSLLHSGLEVG